MKLYAKDKQYTLYNGNMLDMLDVLEPNSIDAIICDPPYELNFMSKGWDRSGIAFNKEAWEKCLEVLKPGGWLLAFGGSRTYHRIACAIEDAGFEIRDCIMWLYGSGFPKSQNIGLMVDKHLGVESKVIGTKIKNSSPLPGNHNGSWCDNQKDGEFKVKQARNKWDGWGTCLKPAYEPIVMARKPFKGSLVDNVLEHGVGGLNIDECKIGIEGGKKKVNIIPNSGSKNCGFGCNGELVDAGGRFPANVIIDGSDEVVAGMPDTSSSGGVATMPKMSGGELGICNFKTIGAERVPTNYIMPNDKGSASRYFYCAKASKKDRDEGMDSFKIKQCVGGGIDNYLDDVNSCKFDSEKAPQKNIHPTVKPIELMQYLIRLITPQGGVILDCFMGSGSTGKACMFENRERNSNYHFIGIELTDEYLPICKARIDYAINKYEYDLKQKEIETGQMNLFDFRN